ncbi:MULTISPECIES: hypothetical protein [unclassified Actinomyces]|uniref:hypothetical protein n=1 Tax=unclassified Actinomyces TaxID=2609248 RepID=UPI00201810CF|nr:MULTISPECIES: hypothetical protein [unclassified Actinomyces]MCL3778435.1 hypothetical protein [Actinomyces sp. AC-20-1]MCL3790004.1 hypothetical protein [Actinomyces sp. 187325]MCL3792547.1 hypothetical protein [Actinomyces sp. 186855]MCL3794580.1 hypothetical protein [Actinomyces sp. 217892]
MTTSPSPSPTAAEWPALLEGAEPIADEEAIRTLVKAHPGFAQATVGDVTSLRDLSCDIWEAGQGSGRSPQEVYEELGEATRVGEFDSMSADEAALVQATYVLWGCPEYQPAVEEATGLTFSRP